MNVIRLAIEKLHNVENFTGKARMVTQRKVRITFVLAGCGIAALLIGWLLKTGDYAPIAFEQSRTIESTRTDALESHQAPSDHGIREYPLSVEWLNDRPWPGILRSAILGDDPFIALDDQSLADLNATIGDLGKIVLYNGVPFFREHDGRPSNLDKNVSVHIENGTVWEAILALVKAMNCRPVSGNRVYASFSTGFWPLVVPEFYDDKVINITLSEVPAVEVLCAIATQSPLFLSFYYVRTRDVEQIFVYAYREGKRVQLTKDQTLQAPDEVRDAGMRRRNLDHKQVDDAIRAGQNCEF